MTKTSVSYDPGKPTAPRFLAPNRIAQDSWRGQPKTYVQDLEARLCTCPDFQHRKAGTGQLCKHLAAVLTTPATEPQPETAAPRWSSVKLSGPRTEAEAWAELAAGRF